METVYKQLDSKEIHDYEIKAQLGKFGIIDETQKIKELSGGQLKRVALAIALITFVVLPNLNLVIYLF